MQTNPQPKQPQGSQNKILVTADLVLDLYEYSKTLKEPAARQNVIDRCNILSQHLNEYLVIKN